MDVRKSSAGDFKAAAERALVGAIVLTRYNNKPYRVDEIAWDQNPQSTFQRSDGSEISYMTYFKNTWNVQIRDDKQPMLINRPKPKRGQVEESKLICLVPELCFMTGLTDDIRSDFRAMRDIAQHTRIPPQARVNAMKTFLENVSNNEDAKKVFLDWNMRIDVNPLTTMARKIANEIMLFGDGKEAKANDKADWTRDATSSRLFEPIEVKTWILVYTQHDEPKAKELCANLVNVSKVIRHSSESQSSI